MAILISISLRVPLVPHEIGWDSFFIHRLAESVTYYHQEKWIINPASFYGYFPYSYPSGVPTILAAFSSMSGLSMEYTILFFTFIEGIMAVFFSFMLGKILFNIKYGKWIFVYISSFAAGLLYYSLWTVSTRGFFMILFILFLFLLFKIFLSKNLKKMEKIKFLLLFIMILFILPSIHRLWVFIIPIWVIAIIVYFYNKRYPLILKKNFVIISLISFILVFFSLELLSTFYKELWTYFGVEDINNPHLYYILGLIYARYNGPLLFLFPLGIYYLFEHRNIKFLIILLFIIILLPFYYVATYVATLSYIIFSIIFAGALIDIFSRMKKHYSHSCNQLHKSKGKVISIGIVISLLTAQIIFAGVVQYYHPNISGLGNKYIKPYMKEGTYESGIWIKYKWHENHRDFIIINYEPHRILAISGDSSISDSGPFELIDGIINPKDVKVKINKYVWEWEDKGPWVPTKEVNTAYSYWYALYAHSPTDQWCKKMRDKFNISIVVINNQLEGRQQGAYNMPPPRSLFYEKIPQENYAIFRNHDFTAYFWGDVV